MPIRPDPPDTSVKPRTRRIVAVVILAVLASLLTAVVGATTANASTTRASVTCYGQGNEWLAAIYGDGSVYYTQSSMVTHGSPCQDVNLRGATANGRAVCRDVRIHWGNGVVGPWVGYCGGNKVLASFAVEDRVFRVEVPINEGPALLAIRS